MASGPGKNPSELDAHLAVLAEHGFPVAKWTAAAIRAIPLSVPKFIKKIGIVTSAADTEQRSVIVGLGVVRGFYNEARHCTLLNFLHFCEYLGSTPGQEALRNRQLSEKPAVGHQQTSDAALLAISRQQISDLGAAEKATRSDYSAKIDELQRQIHAIRAEESHKLGRLRRKFKPAGQYTGISKMEVSDRCLNLYYQQCNDGGIDVPDITDAVRRSVEMRFGSVVRDAHLLEFIKNGNHQEALRSWADERIRYFSANYDVRRANHFRQLMALTGDGQPTGVPLGEPAAEEPRKLKHAARNSREKPWAHSGDTSQ